MNTERYAQILQQVEAFNQQCKAGYRPLWYDENGSPWMIVSAEYWAGHIWYQASKMDIRKTGFAPLLAEFRGYVDQQWFRFLQSVGLQKHRTLRDFTKN